MLKKINEGRVESDQGFYIHITGLEIMKYVDQVYSIDLEWNYDPKADKTYIYLSACNELNNTEKHRVSENIQNAVKLLKGNYDIR